MSARPTVAILGASANRRKFGNKAVRAWAAAGWHVYPIHPSETEVEGFPAFADLAALPEPVQAVSVYLSPEVGLGLLPAIAASGASTVWINPGAESPALQAEAARLRLPVTYGCSIVSLGLSPAAFPA